jgi:hypothetical protein
MANIEPMVEATQASFGTDLRRALAAWRRFPWLPAVSVAIGATFYLPDYLWPLGLVILVLAAAGMDRNGADLLSPSVSREAVRSCRRAARNVAIRRSRVSASILATSAGVRRPTRWITVWS